MIGSTLTNELLVQGHEIIAVVRNDCKKMNALNQSNLITIVSCDMCYYCKLSILIDKKIDIAVSTAWNGIRGKDWSNQELQKDDGYYAE